MKKNAVGEMSENLNIRAAKALGWKFTPWDNHEGQFLVYNPIKGWDFHTNNLEFTTSYDWAMLGVKKCDKFKLDDYFREWFGDYFDCPVDMLLLPPQHITLAWVKVLENEQK